MSHRFAEKLRAETGPKFRPVPAPCLKHVEFYSKNKFEKK